VVAADVAKAARSFLTPERATIVACVPRPPGDQARAATRRTDALAADLASAAGAASVGEERRRWSVRSAGLDRGGASRVVLPGGATFVACQRPGSPLAAVALGFGGGFVDEPPGLGGCTFLLHRLLARGTRSLSGTGFADGLERLGSRPSPACDRDGFGVGATMLPRDLPAALELLLMAVAEPAFGNDELEAVRAEAVAELEGAAGDPRRRALRLVTPLVFGGHPYGRPLRGTIESLRGISLDDLLAWHRATCVPSRLVVCAAGEFHAERAAAEVERVAAGMDRGEAAVSHAGDTRKLDHRGPGRAGMTSVAERTDHPLSAVAVGFRAPPGGSPESAAMRVICAALSMRGGRLWRALRDKPPHAYAVHATHLALARAGAVVIHATLTPGTEDRTAEALTAVARSLAFGGLDAAELRRARAHAVGALELSRERCSVVAAGCAAAEAAGFGHRWFERLPDSVASVGVEDAERVAASWLAPDRGFASVTTRGRP
jgi:zinc protease